LELADQSIHLDADADKLRQVLINLHSNACDASPAGTSNKVETAHRRRRTRRTHRLRW
jgi:signal transduction histidine kinase